MVQSWCAEKAEDLPDVEYIMPDGCCSCHSPTVRQHEEIQLISVHPVFLAFFRIQTVDAVEFILGKLFAFFSCALKGYVTVHMIWIDNFCCPPRSKRSLECSFEKIHLQYLCTTFRVFRRISVPILYDSLLIYGRLQFLAYWPVKICRTSILTNKDKQWCHIVSSINPTRG